MNTLRTLAAAAAAFACCAAAHAGPAPDLFSNGNMWTVTAYDDSSPNHDQLATQTLCFYPTAVAGTQLSGIWYSPSFYDWNGTWRQEGDQIFMTGDYAGDAQGNALGHDSMEWELVTMEKRSEGFGHWREWRENGLTGNVIGYGNAKFVRVGQCAYRPPVGVDGATVEKLVVEQGLQAPRRYRIDGKEALGPNDRLLVPLN